MAEWNKDNIMLTAKGASVLSKVQTGQGYLNITRAVASSQVVPVEYLANVETLDPENLELSISGRRESGDGGSIVLLQLSNLQLEDSFQMNEIGIFATHSEDPENEFLYIIAQVETGTGDRIPSKDITPVTATYDFYLYNLKSGDVTFEVSATGLATVSQLNDAVHRLEDRDTAIEAKVDANTEAINNLGFDAESVENSIKELNVPVLYSRVSQVEREQVNILLKLDAENLFPDCNMLLIEDFQTINQLDRLSTKVTSCAAGDDSVDVQSNRGFIIGSWYWITDGVHCEYVQIRSAIKNGNIYRVILTEPLVNTYDIEMTSLYRTTAWISDGKAYGSGDVLGYVYRPSVMWRGSTTGGTAQSNEAWVTTQSNADNFNISGSIIFTGDGSITLTM